MSVGQRNLGYSNQPEYARNEPGSVGPTKETRFVDGGSPAVGEVEGEEKESPEKTRG